MIRIYGIKVFPQEDYDLVINDNTMVTITVTYKEHRSKSDEFSLKMMKNMCVGRNVPYKILPDYRLVQQFDKPIFAGEQEYDKWFFARDLLAVPIRTKLFV